MNDCKTLFLLFVSNVIIVKGDFYSAVTEIESLLETEKYVIENLEKHINRNKCKLKIVKKYLTICKEEHNIAMKNVTNYTSNPINCFRLIKRLSVDYDHIVKLISERINFQKNVSLTYPTVKDLEGAAEAILRLETTYNLNITDLAEGRWNSKNRYGGKYYRDNVSPMTTSDCIELGKALSRLKHFRSATNWFNEASRKFQQGIHDDGRYSEDDSKTELAKGYVDLENFVKSFFSWTDRLIDLNPRVPVLATIEYLMEYYRQGLQVEEVSRNLQKQLESEEKPRKSKSKIQSTKNRDRFYYDPEDYYTLCRAEFQLPTRKKRNLKCFFTFGAHRSLRIAPVKTELLHRSPDITMLHDVINDDEIQTIVNLAKGSLEMCEVHAGSSFNAVPDRICKASFLNNTSFVSKIKSRISVFTGLDLRSSEKIQVANYGIGGYYTPHFDFWTNETYIESNGNRIATALFYLSNVEQGGATVFLKLGVSVFPVKGAMLFWKNLLPSGHVNYDTLHAACPVLKGSKWVFTQWINIHGQELHQPCPAHLK